MLDAKERSFVRAAAAQALGELEDPALVGVLSGVAAAPGNPPELKLAVIDCLCRLAQRAEDAEAMRAVSALMRDEDLLVSARAESAVAGDCGRAR